MEAVENFSTEKLFHNILKASKKISENYLENFSGYHRDAHDIALTYCYFFTKLFAEPNEVIKVQNYYIDFLQKQQDLWQGVITNCENDQRDKLAPFISLEKGDKRFMSSQWNKNIYFEFIKLNYLLIEKLVLKIVDEVEMGEPIRKKLDFYTQQYTNLFSPANFLLTNPEILELTIKTKGENLWKGFNYLIKDIEKGRITQIDESVFELGKTLAITAGAVIYENELIQLIQYTPSSKNVYEVPLLIIPPWINKYYILDLQSENSFVKFMVNQGFSVFIVSWKNPPPKMGYFTFDDYVNKGALASIDVVQNISEAKKINVLGYCLGGTLLGITCSILSAQKRDVINSVTFLASMIDFSDIGPMGDVINEALVTKLEKGELLKDDVMHGHDMERAFNLIRSKDLIWNYAINNYLKGIEPAAFDVIYWTNDNTNLPASMYIYYMKQMIFKNRLSRKNALRISDTLIDIGKIKSPVYVIALKEDYISPPQTAFTTTELVDGPVEFILGGSGHVMGVANPPSRKKYGYYLDGKLGYGYDEWKRTAHFFEGSWWMPWSDRLKKKSGKQTPASKLLGNKKYKEVEPAPGSYVKETC
jgi:polyhydroxyalkanoate synthase